MNRLIEFDIITNNKKAGYKDVLTSKDLSFTDKNMMEEQRFCDIRRGASFNVPEEA